jgi:hypothetical protein
MKMDDIRRYIDLRDSLVREKSELEQRLNQINEALGQADGAPKAAASAPISRSKNAGQRRGRPARGGISLRDAVLQVTASGPKTKEDILQGVKNLGYKFSTKNPLNSLGVILYGKNPKFKNENGKFQPVAGSASKATAPSAAPAAFRRKKRQMSPEARERIAAAQRARWAKAKAK